MKRIASALAGAGLALAVATSAVSQVSTTPISATPGVTGIVVWEVTTNTFDHPFAVPSAELDPITSLPLDSNNNDIAGHTGGGGNEYYDVFLSDITGAHDPNGPCVRINGRYGGNSSGFNIARIDLMNGSSVMRSFDRLIDYNTAQLGAQSGSQHFIVDPDPGIQPSTYAAFGSGSLDLYAVICLSTPPITLTKTLTSPVPILAPTNVTFELAPVLTNTALFEGRTLAVTDTLPAGLTYTSATGTDWACSASGQVVTCIYTVPTGGGAVTQVPPVTLTAQVDAAMASGDYSNCAVLSDPESAPTDPAAIWLPLELATAPACADMPVRHLVDRYHYAVKYVCGAQDNDAEPEAATTLAQGRYFTEINILNPGYLAADLEKRVYPLTLDTTDVYREPAQTPATGGEDMTLNPGHATFDDCLKLGEMLGADDLAEKRASIGWLSITSPHPLDVTAVYTGRDIDRDNATSIDVEQVSGRVVQIAQ